MADPNRGEIWLANLGPGEGHEQFGQRPVLTISDDRFNQNLSGLVIAIPLTSKIAKSKKISSHVIILPPEGGVKVPSAILCDQMRSISKGRLVGSSWGTIASATMSQVETVLKYLLGL